MRPKKLILVLNPSAIDLGCVMFSLLVNGYKTIGAQTLDQAAKILKRENVHAVLYTRDFMSKPLHVPPHLKSLPMVRVRDTFAETLMAIKVEAAMKRGPKKGWKRIDKTSANVQNNANGKDYASL